MLAEFAPSRGRGRRPSTLLVYRYVGYLASVVLAYALVDLAGLGWRWVLVTGALPALVVLIMRAGLPESRRWLVQHGRVDPRASTIAANAVAALGAVVGMLTIERMGRRRQLIGQTLTRTSVVARPAAAAA